MKKYTKIFAFLIALIIVLSTSLIYAGYNKKKKDENMAMLVGPFAVGAVITSAMAMSSSTDTIDNANFATMDINISEVETGLQVAAITLKGQMAMNAKSVTDAQVYNFVANGENINEEEYLTSDLWLTRQDAQDTLCTKINKDNVQDVIDIELPLIKVYNQNEKLVEASYYITNQGEVFIWPPYEHENEYYVNGITNVLDKNGEAITNKNSSQMYEKDFVLTVGSVEIPVGEYLK